MKKAGYDEQYRRQVLDKALNLYDKMRKEDEDGTTPLNRPREWKAEERRQQKKKKKNSWSKKGGYVAPIFVPPTPNGELARLLKEIADKEAESGVRFKIVETGGRTVQSVVQKSNPTETVGCTDWRCVACKDGRVEQTLYKEFQCNM